MSNKFPFIANEFSSRKRALVTGGTAGIGEAIARRLLGGGAIVITTSRNSKSDHEEREHLFIESDLSTSVGCTEVINEVIKSRLGGVDILVNVLGASSAPSGGFSVLSDDEWQKELNINLLAAVRLDRGLLRSMIRQYQVWSFISHRSSDGFRDMKPHWLTLLQRLH